MNTTASNSVSRFFILLLLVVVGFLAYDRIDEFRAGREIAKRVLEGRRPLFDRLGGKAGIEAVTDDFLSRLTKELRFQRLFAGAPPELLKTVRNHLVEQLCEATGGPCKYSGRDMRTVHKGMAITEEDWNTTLGLLQSSLDRYHVASREQEELKAIIATTKAAIVE